MSIEVIKEAVAYKASCPSCKSVLRFTKEDIEQDCWRIRPHIICPVCDYQIEVCSVGNELSPYVDPIYKGEMPGKVITHPGTVLL